MRRKMVVRYSEDKETILKVLKKNGVSSLWHFTDIGNLPLIKRLGGLRSKEYLDREGLWNTEYVYPGGDALSHELDKMLGNWDKISLNFTPHTPMAYNKKPESHLLFTEIDPVVATFAGVYFTDCNAARIRNRQLREKGIEGLENVRFDMINTNPEPWNPDWLKYVQAEVLVPNFISMDHFKRIYFVSDVSLEFCRYLWREDCALFCTGPKIFADIDYHGKWTLRFPYIEKVFITEEEVTKENYTSVGSSDKYIRKNLPFWIVIHLFAPAGTSASVKINPTNQASKWTFEKQDAWICWSHFMIEDELEKIEIDVYINEILWLKREVGVRT